MQKKVDKKLGVLVLTVLAVFILAFYEMPRVYGIEPGVYTAVMTPHYAHPQTGVIEDSGGEESRELGQKMTEGATSRNALVEVDRNGKMYATVRFTLLTNTSTPHFQINKSEVVAECTKSSGDIGDFRLPIPDLNCVIRCNMNVIPMDRDVIFYMTLSDFTPGAGDFVTKVKAVGKEEETKTQLVNNRTEAKNRIDTFKNLSKKQKKEFIAKIDNASSVNAIDGVVGNARKQNAAEAAKTDIGKVKGNGLKKIDKMKNLSEKNREEVKDRVLQAKSIEEVKEIVGEAEKSKPIDMSVVIGMGIVITAVVLALIVVIQRRKKKHE